MIKAWGVFFIHFKWTWQKGYKQVNLELNSTIAVDLIHKGTNSKTPLSHGDSSSSGTFA